MLKLSEAVKKARRVYICGNGGSAANAIHIANDLISVGIKAHALTADVATLTAIANDFGYEDVFANQLLVFGEPGDLLIALSGSGNSLNILKAILTAKRIGMDTFAISGTFANPHALDYADNAASEGTTMQAAETYQLIIGHEVMLQLKKERQ